MDDDTGLKRLALNAAWHAVNVLLNLLIFLGGIGAGYLAWKEFGQLGLTAVILTAAWLRLRHDIRAIREGRVDLPPEYASREAQDEQPSHPFHKAGRD